jgi:hypothetical protein
VSCPGRCRAVRPHTPAVAGSLLSRPRPAELNGGVNVIAGHGKCCMVQHRLLSWTMVDSCCWAYLLRQCADRVHPALPDTSGCLTVASTPAEQHKGVAFCPAQLLQCAPADQVCVHPPEGHLVVMMRALIPISIRAATVYVVTLCHGYSMTGQGVGPTPDGVDSGLAAHVPCQTVQHGQHH